ncbi:MAG: hypothetical protein M1818_004642 [Claussenomyces sp. TS43310]|nr:MAG: hypothetical protein M1818_004642 [Claussenomyces sp. TS43310]
MSWATLHGTATRHLELHLQTNRAITVAERKRNVAKECIIYADDAAVNETRMGFIRLMEHEISLLERNLLFRIIDWATSLAPESDGACEPLDRSKWAWREVKWSIEVSPTSRYTGPRIILERLEGWMNREDLPVMTFEDAGGMEVAGWTFLALFAGAHGDDVRAAGQIIRELRADWIELISLVMDVNFAEDMVLDFVPDPERQWTRFAMEIVAFWFRAHVYGGELHPGLKDTEAGRQVLDELRWARSMMRSSSGFGHSNFTVWDELLRWHARPVCKG